MILFDPLEIRMRLIYGSVAVAVALVVTGCDNDQGATIISSLERLAKAGNAEALYHLGMAYQTGSGTAEDPKKALHAFQKAAAMGDPLASYKLGCYYDGQGEGLIAQDTDQALKYKLIAAQAGYALAQQDVATLYARRGDVKTALTWLEKSAAQGWSGGLMTLASVYNGASGVERDAAKTAGYFRLSFEQSNPSEVQRNWLTQFEKGLSLDDKKRADDLVRGFQPKPTQITVKALSGQRAAEQLIRGLR
jgi:uncharacterized protein